MNDFNSLDSKNYFLGILLCLLSSTFSIVYDTALEKIYMTVAIHI